MFLAWYTAPRSYSCWRRRSNPGCVRCTVTLAARRSDTSVEKMMAHLRSFFGKLYHAGLETQVFAMLKLASPLWAGLDYDGSTHVSVPPGRNADPENHSEMLGGHAGDELFEGLCKKLRDSGVCGPPGTDIHVGGVTYSPTALRDFAGNEMVPNVLSLVCTGEMR